MAFSWNLFAFLILGAFISACNSTDMKQPGAAPSVSNAPAAANSSTQGTSVPAINAAVPTREYWLTVESVPWNVAPHADEATGELIPASEATIAAIRFKAYTPDFKEALPEDPLLGIAGPVIEAQIGDHVIVHFKNLDSVYKQPHSLHVHGLQYTPAMDGGYSASDAGKPGTAVRYGETFTYTYDAYADSVGVWPYHDHSVDAQRSLALGMYGAIRVRKADEPRPDAEFYLFMSGMDQEFTKLKRDFDVFNGRAYMGNTPHLMVNKGDRVRFNIIGFGSEFHTFHIHGYRWMEEGHPEDVHVIGPASAWHFEIIANNPGMWMYHCHVEEHMKNGMMGMFMVMD
jgi:FtsP/CotA-like multicopper oxidase with cupredoxin domain